MCACDTVMGSDSGWPNTTVAMTPMAVPAHTRVVFWRVSAGVGQVANYEKQSVIDIQKAQRVLGWSPTPFAEFIKATVDWHTPLLKI